MNNKTYRTKELADIIGIHINTVRFYEKIGFLTEPKRLANGYRVYTQLQLDQCVLIRLAMKAEVLQNGLRAKAVEIIKLCAELNFDSAAITAEEYSQMLYNETKNAKAAITAVEEALSKSEIYNSTLCLKRCEAAKMLGITSETLRTWERSGLLSVKRSKNGYRVYNAGDMKRLNIIRTLRCANYSLTSILRLLSALDSHTEQSVEKALNNPNDNEDIISVCDRLLVSLENTQKDAQSIILMIDKMKKKYKTLH